MRSSNNTNENPLYLFPLFCLGRQFQAQLSDPLPATIEYGDVTIELEDWVTLRGALGAGVDARA